MVNNIKKYSLYDVLKLLSLFIFTFQFIYTILSLFYFPKIDWDIIVDVMIPNRYHLMHPHIFSFLLPVATGLINPSNIQVYLTISIAIVLIVIIASIYKLNSLYGGGIFSLIAFLTLIFINNSFFSLLYTFDDNIFQVPVIFLTLYLFESSKINSKDFSFIIGVLSGINLAFHIQVILFIFGLFLFERNKVKFLFGIATSYFCLLLVSILWLGQENSWAMFRNVKIYSNQKSWSLFANLRDTHFDLSVWFLKYTDMLKANLSISNSSIINLIYIIFLFFAFVYYYSEQKRVSLIIIGLLVLVFPFIYEPDSAERWVTIFPVIWIPLLYSFARMERKCIT